MHLQVCRGEEKGKNTRRTGRWARANNVRVNSLPKSGSQARDLLLSFIFATSLCLIRFDRDRPSRLQDAVSLGGSSLYIRAAVTKIAAYQ
jgi:hypothetical protein